ncbi:MAG: VOC family protein [Chitinophagaceae bacterium]
MKNKEKPNGLRLGRLDHVLISIPPGTKEAAHTFYSDILQMEEIPGNHPNGAIWFNMGNIQLHIREEEGHKEDSDRHPAFEVEDLDVAKDFIRSHDIPVSYSSKIQGRERCFFRDPFGNRFELIAYQKQKQ